jgi:hypothetical protein
MNKDFLQHGCTLIDTDESFYFLHRDRTSMKEMLCTLRVDNFSMKIDGVAADLAAHRADTESHQERYRVSDEK